MTYRMHGAKHILMFPLPELGISVEPYVSPAPVSIVVTQWAPATTHWPDVPKS